MGDAKLLSELEGKLRHELEAKYVDAKQKLAVSGERLATDMLTAESVKLRNLMNGPHASVDAVESELHRYTGMIAPCAPALCIRRLGHFGMSLAIDNLGIIRALQPYMCSRQELCLLNIPAWPSMSRPSALPLLVSRLLG